MAVKLTKPLYGHAANTIVRDLPADIERTLTAGGQAAWHLEDGIEASGPTFPPGLSDDDRTHLVHHAPRRIPSGQPFIGRAPVFRLTVRCPTAAVVTINHTGSDYVPPDVTDPATQEVVPGGQTADVSRQTVNLPAGGWTYLFIENTATYYAWESTATDTVVELLP